MADIACLADESDPSAHDLAGKSPPFFLAGGSPPAFFGPALVYELGTQRTADMDPLDTRIQHGTERAASQRTASVNGKSLFDPGEQWTSMGRGPVSLAPGDASHNCCT